MEVNKRFSESRRHDRQHGAHLPNGISEFNESLFQSSFTFFVPGVSVPEAHQPKGGHRIADHSITRLKQGQCDTLIPLNQSGAAMTSQRQTWSRCVDGELAEVWYDCAADVNASSAERQGGVSKSFRSADWICAQDMTVFTRIQPMMFDVLPGLEFGGGPGTVPSRCHPIFS